MWLHGQRTTPHVRDCARKHAPIVASLLSAFGRARQEGSTDHCRSYVLDAAGKEMALDFAKRAGPVAQPLRCGNASVVTEWEDGIVGGVRWATRE